MVPDKRIVIGNDGMIRRMASVLSLVKGDRSGDTVGDGGAPQRHPGQSGPLREGYPGRGNGGCKMLEAGDLGPGCYRDDCGNVFIKVNGAWRRVKREDSIRKRPMSVRGVITLSTTNEVSARVEIAPTVPHFVAYALLTNVTFPAGSGLTEDYVGIESMKIGNTQQDVGSVKGESGFANVESGMSLSTFKSTAFNNTFDWDEATPSLGIKVAIVIPPSAVAGEAVITLNFFGTTFEDLSSRGRGKPKKRCTMGMVFLFDNTGWTRNPQKDQVVLYALIRAQAEINRGILRGGHYPSLYRSGVIYKEEIDAEKNRVEIFRDIPSVIENGGSDCNNLVAWKFAEYLEQGKPCDIKLSWQMAKREDGRGYKWLYHASLSLPGGREECPSTILGM